MERNNHAWSMADTHRYMNTEKKIAVAHNAKNRYFTVRGSPGQNLGMFLSGALFFVPPPKICWVNSAAVHWLSAVANTKD